MVGRWMGSLGCPAAPKIGWLGFFAKDMNLGSDLLLFHRALAVKSRVWVQHDMKFSNISIHF